MFNIVFNIMFNMYKCTEDSQYFQNAGIFEVVWEVEVARGQDSSCQVHALQSYTRGLGNHSRSKQGLKINCDTGTCNAAGRGVT